MTQAHSARTEAHRACPECSGPLQWSARAQSLQCPYCGTRVPEAMMAADAAAQPTPKSPNDPSGVLAPDSPPAGNAAPIPAPSAIAEQDLLAALRDPANLRGWGDVRHEVQCQSCRAISVFVQGRAAQRCDFCGSPAIVAHEGGGEAITPQSILPFQVSESQVRDAVRQWYASRWWAPGKLRQAALTDTLHGVYLPYWTFDAHVSAHWSAEAGYYYYTTETYQDNNGELRTRQVRHIRWESAQGRLRHFFDDALVPGTIGVHAPLLRQIEPFPTTTDLRAYSPEYVRGWTVERYQIDLARAANHNEAQMDAAVRELCARQIPGDTWRNLHVQRQYTGRTFKHVLVPIWLVSYRYGRKNYQVVLNGYTHRIAGEYPKSWVKILFAILAAIIAVVILLGLAGHLDIHHTESPRIYRGDTMQLPRSF